MSPGVPSVGQTSSPHLRPKPRGGRGGPGRAAPSQRRQGAADAPLSFLSPISQSDQTHLLPQDGVLHNLSRILPHEEFVSSLHLLI